MKGTNISPRVSIGLPVYNSEKYLEKALQAILQQTFADFELIISDNASTDRTGEICKAFAAKDCRVRYYRNQENLGASKNFSRVFELSRGEYFRWAAYDDLMAPEAIERCVDVLERDPGVILCYTRTINIDQNGDVIDYYDDDFGFDSQEAPRRFHDFLRRVYEYNCNAMFGLIRRTALERTSLIGNYHSSDKVLLAQLVLKGRFHEVPEYLFFKRFHADVSTAVCKTEEEFAEWHDTSKKDRPAYPLLKRTLEFVKAIASSPLNWGQMASCYGYLAAFYLFGGKRWKMYVERIIK